MARSRLSACFGLGLGLLTPAGYAWAADGETTPGKAAAESKPAEASGELGAKDASVKQDEPPPYWSEGEPRLFLSSAVDFGFQYARPRLSVGYGKPFRTWVGLDANPVATARAFGGYAGLRGATRYLNLRVGARYQQAYERTYLPIRDDYNRIDVEYRGVPSDPALKYLAWEYELTIEVPVGPGTVQSETSSSYFTGIPEDLYIFSHQQVIVAPPWLHRQRLGYFLDLTDSESLGVGVAAEVVWVPERPGRNHTWRAGMLVRQSVSDSLTVRLNLLPTIVSPDHLGLVGGEFAEIGIRWRWSTGMPERKRITKEELRNSGN